MKKITLLIGVLLMMLFEVSGQIAWMGNEYTTLSGTQYLGDNILFEIQSFPIASNQGTQVYIDWGNNGYNAVLNYDYYPLNWIRNDGNNSVWNRSVKMREVGTHNRRYLGWQNGQPDHVTENFGTFTVSALSNPTSPSATSASTSQINLTWSKWNDKNVMILRKKSNESWTEPTQDTNYEVNATIGSAVVVYNGDGTSFNSTEL